MHTSNLSAAHLHDDAAALAYLEEALWPNGPVCPHCGATDRIYTLKGKSTRPGVRKCGHCRKPFTVTVGTVLERSHIPLHKWLQAICLMTSSKKGISAHQLHRTLGLKYQTAWSMAHRIREAMRDGSLGPLGGANTPVEADETFIGRKEGVPVPKGGYSHKHIVLGLVERGGKVRTAHIDTLTSEEIGRIVRENLDRESWLMTDEGRHYRKVGEELRGHSRVHHTMGEYVDPDDATVNTNTIEGYFSIFKRSRPIVAARADRRGNITHVKLAGNRSYTPMKTAYGMAKRGEISNAHAVNRKDAKPHIRTNPDGRVGNNLDTMAGDT